MSKVLLLHDNGGVHTSVHTTEVNNKFLDGHNATFVLQSWTCTIRLTPVWSPEKVSVKMPLSQQWNNAECHALVMANEGKWLFGQE